MEHVLITYAVVAIGSQQNFYIETNCIKCHFSVYRYLPVESFVEFYLK